MYIILLIKCLLFFPLSSFMWLTHFESHQWCLMSSLFFLYCWEVCGCTTVPLFFYLFMHVLWMVSSFWFLQINLLSYLNLVLHIHMFHLICVNLGRGSAVPELQGRWVDNFLRNCRLWSFVFLLVVYEAHSSFISLPTVKGWKKPISYKQGTKGAGRHGKDLYPGRSHRVLLSFTLLVLPESVYTNLQFLGPQMNSFLICSLLHCFVVVVVLFDCFLGLGVLLWLIT